MILTDAESVECNVGSPKWDIVTLSPVDECHFAEKHHTYTTPFSSFCPDVPGEKVMKG